MAKVHVDTSKQYPPVVPTGVHRAIIQKAVWAVRSDDAPFDPGFQYVTWHLRWDDPKLPEEVNGTLTFADTCVEEYRSAQFVRFMEAIGRDASTFEYDEETGELFGVQDIPVRANVTHRMGKKVDEEGQKRIFPRIQSVHKAE